MRMALLLFVLALIPRLLFWQATEDRDLAWSLAFAGDAPVWQAQAAAGAANQGPSSANVARELMLPLRPPAMTWIVSALWDGAPSGTWKIRIFFALLGASIAPLCYLLAQRLLTAHGALCCGVLVALATNLILLSSGPHAEILYLALLLLSLFDQERLRTHPTVFVALRYGALQGFLCLVRVEHLLTFALLLVLLVSAHAPSSKRTLALAIASALALLVPYQLDAMARVAEYNARGGPAIPSDAGRPPRFLPWEPAAMARLQALPAFQRMPTLGFVTETMRVRGANKVSAEDFAVIKEAFGSMPEPLPTPWIALYGGLNFFLANSAEAAGGFSNAALHRSPPLTGGDERYPHGLRDVLPKEGELNFGYPPHLHVLRHGYALGFEEQLAEPSAALARCMQKFLYASEGVASGFGTANLPLGLHGQRRAVDLATPASLASRIYTGVWILVGALGLWLLRHDPRSWPWLVILATKLLIVLAFFGYARQGALLLPVFALGVASVLDRTLLKRSLSSRPRWIVLGIAVALLVYDLQRTVRGAELTLDGQRVTTQTAAEDQGHRTRDFDASL